MTVHMVSCLQVDVGSFLSSFPLEMRMSKFGC
jgi:hypothetical protein